VVVADRAVIEAVGHSGVGDGAALAHPGGEPGHDRDRVVDGALGDAEELRQLGVGGAQQAVVTGKFSVFRLVARGGVRGRSCSILSRSVEQNRNIISATLVKA
jgi:hypothetical protein